MAARLVRRGVREGSWFVLACAVAVACTGESPLGGSDTPVQTASLAPRPAAAPAPMKASAPVDLSGGAAPGFAVHSILEPDRYIEPGDYAWNEEGAPAKATRIVIDVETQRIYVYRGGVEIGRSSLIYGADDKPTPLGTFEILEKDADHVSNLYDAEMPYMLRLTWDGIAIHGSEVDDEYATHGCIGIPEEFAALLFEQAKLGDRVLVTKNWMRDTYEREGQTETV